MDAIKNVPNFFKEFHLITNQLKQLVPSLNDKLLDVLSHQQQSATKENSDEEVFAGLPTVSNAKSMLQELARCVPTTEEANQISSSPSPSVPLRHIFNKLELIAILCNIYELNSAEELAWSTIEQLAHKTRRVLDEMYAMINHLFLRLTLTERRHCSDAARLHMEIGELQNYLVNARNDLVAAYEDLVTTVKLPTPHAYIQCIVSDALLVYIQHYSNWDAINSRLDLLLIRHDTFLKSKSWAAVYCQGFVTWLRLRTRCSTGAPASETDNQSGSLVNFSILYTAINVRVHGRTLVRFMLSHCEQKTKMSADTDKENQDPLPTNDGVWCCSMVTDLDLLNLWLGTRFLIQGTTHVAELYTLLGTVKEARAYQLELLRISQRFHIPSCAQTAICLMAHTDLLAQRKWAFELRLSQLNHMLHNSTPISEVLKGNRQLKLQPLPKKEEHQRPTRMSDGEGNFLKTNIPLIYTNACQNDNDSDDSRLASSMAANPLINAAAGGSEDLFPTSPVKAVGGYFTSPEDGFPSIPGLVRAISGDVVQHDLITRICAHRILNGCLWLWVGEVGEVVREEILSKDHFLSALHYNATTNREDDIPPILVPSKVSPPEVKDNEASLADSLQQLCQLTPPSSLRNPSAATPSTKAARAAVRIACFRTPLVKPLCDGEVRKKTKAPDAPRRLADLEFDNPAPQRTLRQTRRTITQYREKCAPPDRVKPAPMTGDTFATPLPVRTHRPRKAENMGDEHSATITSSSSSSSSVRSINSHAAFALFGPLGSSSGFTFGPQCNAKTPASRSLQIHRDNEPSVEQMTTPRCRLFKDSKPIKCAERRKRVVLKSDDDEEEEEETESCPLISMQPPRPRNLRLGSRWATTGRSHIAHPDSPLKATANLDTAAARERIERGQDEFAERLHQAYLRLSGMPIPALMRPVCQWLGLRWAGKTASSVACQVQAGRFFAQAVGLAATNLYTSILSAKSNIQNNEQARILSAVYSVTAPNELHLQSELHLKSSAPLLAVVQLMLVDELGEFHNLDHKEEEDGAGEMKVTITRTPKDLIPGGLGSRRCAFLVATRWLIYPADQSSSSIQPPVSVIVPGAPCHSRVLHHFSVNGLQHIEAFNEIQTASLDSMHENDRRRFWGQRFALDNRLQALIDQMRGDWFTKDDLDWIHGRHESNPGQLSTVLVLDRCLVFLPWEWIIWGTSVGVENQPIEQHQQPAICRSFSLSLVVGQLAARLPTTPFNPSSAFYVLNPEANLPHTETQFSAFIREYFPSWTGVTGKMPLVKDVIHGFTHHDLFVYLGHGNGSRFLMNTFDEGLAAKAVALIIGCSSGRPRLEGRHEPYASVFNHLIAGSSTVLSLLWDVTDRDIDRFTESFLSRWLIPKKKTMTTLTESSEDAENVTTTSSVSFQIFKAVSACKLQSLVGKSVVVYGLPAIPTHLK